MAPAVGVAGEELLEGLGEAGLAGAVAADDEGEAGAGDEVEGGRLADAAEAFDGDGVEVGDARAGGPLRVLGLELDLGLGAAERLGEGGVAVERAEDEVLGLVLEVGLCRCRAWR